MHTLTIPLKTTKYDRQIMIKRFYAASKVHNTIVKHARKLLIQLDHDKEYQELRDSYIGFNDPDHKLSKDEEKLKKSLARQMNVIRKNYGLTEHALQAYIKKSGPKCRKCLSSQQLQKIATRVWKGVENILFNSGEELHFKANSRYLNIGGKSNANGAKFDKETMTVSWLGLELKCKIRQNEKNLAYIEQSLDHKIKYCEISRKMFSDGWHYYVIIYLDGEAPKKITNTGKRRMGIDPGVSMIACVGDDVMILEELAPRCKEYNKKIVKLQRSIDISQRITNPNKYKSDGTFKEGNKDKWIFSKTCLKKKRLLTAIYRQKAAYIKQCHEILANRLIMTADEFIVEKMNFKALQKKTKKTKKKQEYTPFKKNDGTIIMIRKYKKKKRYGKSLNNRAPASLLTILKRKCNLYGATFEYIDTNEFKASQYDHISDTCIKCSINQRIKIIGDHKVQRDLYSAFLIRNTNEELNFTDREKCIRGFDNFIVMHDKLVDSMKKMGTSMKQCFGF